jgi:hypothetical protein
MEGVEGRDLRKVEEVEVMVLEVRAEDQERVGVMAKGVRAAALVPAY